jgi:hypothetical protein
MHPLPSAIYIPLEAITLAAVVTAIAIAWWWQKCKRTAAWRHEVERHFSDQQ